jgi:hypothetical protein
MTEGIRKKKIMKEQTKVKMRQKKRKRMKNKKTKRDKEEDKDKDKDKVAPDKERNSAKIVQKIKQKEANVH